LSRPTMAEICKHRNFLKATVWLTFRAFNKAVKAKAKAKA
jgi:hypothetical protein